MTQPEGRLSQKIIKLIKERGGYSWKVHGNEFTPTGTPDIVGVYRGLFIAVETKMPGNDLSERQRYVIGQMRLAGAMVLAPCFFVHTVHSMLIDIDRWLETPRDTIEGHKCFAILDHAYGRHAS